MKKKKILLLIPLAIIAGLLVYSFTIFLSTDYIATWRHYMALALLLVLIFLFFKDFKVAVLATGFYLLLGICNLLAMTNEVGTSWIKIFSIETPHINFLSFGLFCLYLVLNFDTLINIYLDYKEAKGNESR